MERNRQARGGRDDPWEDVFPKQVPDYPLTPELLVAVERWENQPQNRPGSDKTWVEEALANCRRDVEGAVRIR